MPLYEYECQSCKSRTEVVQRFSAEPLTICEECSGPLKKLISSPAFQFKGSGFYVTDYPKAGARSDSESGSSAEKADGKTAMKTEGSSSGAETKASERNKSESKSSDSKSSDSKSSESKSSESKSSEKSTGT